MGALVRQVSPGRLDLGRLHASGSSKANPGAKLVQPGLNSVCAALLLEHWPAHFTCLEGPLEAGVVAL